MKPTQKPNGKYLALAMACGLTLALVSWTGGERPGGEQYPQLDTIPKKPSPPKDLDQVLAELNAIDLEEAMENARQQIEKAIKEIDTDRIRLDIEKAMKEVDFDRIGSQLRESLAKLDPAKLKQELGDAWEEIDLEKIETELKESLEEINMEDLKKEMEKIREFDLKKFEEEMKKLKEELSTLAPRMEKELAQAKGEIEKARTGLLEFRGFVDGLEKDGLISRKEGFTLEHAEGELFINGKKAPTGIYNKYSDFLRKHRKFNMVQDDKDFKLDED